MVYGNDRNRVAMTVFENGPSLCRLLSDFDTAGLAAEQMGFAGRSSAISDLLQACEVDKHTTERIGVFLRETEQLALIVGDEKLVISRGSLWPTLRCFANAPGEPLLAAQLMTARFRDELTAYIVKGAILFGVRTVSIDQQRSCTRTLLQHSTHRVHTLEFPH